MRETNTSKKRCNSVPQQEPPTDANDQKEAGRPDLGQALEILKKGISSIAGVVNSISALSAEETRRVLMYEIIGKTIEAKYEESYLNLAAAISILVGDDSQAIRDHFQIDSLGTELPRILEVIRTQISSVYVTYSVDKSQFEVKATILLSNNSDGREYVVGSSIIERDDILDSVRKDFILSKSGQSQNSTKLCIYEKED